MKPKFELGQEVKIIADGREGSVRNVLYDSFNLFRYQVTMNTVNFVTNKIVEGFITLSEDELEAVETKENDK